jgi:hypothetical protein
MGRHTISVLIILIIAAGAALPLFRQETLVKAAQAGTVIILVPPDQAHPGEPIQVKLVASGAQNLAGFQATVRYDTSLRMAGIVAEGGLTGSGRGIVPLAPIRREGAVLVGAATCPVADCAASDYTLPRASLGVNGNVILATLELVASEPGHYQLAVEDVQLVDPQANQLGAATSDVTLEVTVK